MAASAARVAVLLSERMPGLDRQVDLAERLRRSQVNIGASTSKQGQGQPLTPIVVEASAPGLRSATVSISVSTDASRDSVLAVASRYAGKPVLGFD